MQIILNTKTGLSGSKFIVDETGKSVGRSLKEINRRLAGYDRLLAERNKLDLYSQQQAITIAELNKVIGTLRGII